MLTIAFFNPFQSKHLVDISKIKKITSNQTFEFESDFSMENTYSVLRDSYNLEYTDKNEMIRVVRFKLLRRKNATAIINMLTKKPQKNRNIDFHL